MKKGWSLCLVLALLVLMAGCVKIQNLTSVTRIDIAKYSTEPETFGNMTHYTIVESQQDIDHICENLSSLSLKKMWDHKPQEMEYTLTFYVLDEGYTTIYISGYGYVGFDRYYHSVERGKLDLEYIDALLEGT